MKLMLDQDGRIKGYTRDPLSSNFTIEVAEADLPVGPDELADLCSYIYADGAFTLSPVVHKELVKILPDTILGDKQHNTALTLISGYAGVPITLEGECAVPDRTFQLPLTRDGTRTFFFDAIVKDGRFRVVANFPTAGVFMYTNKEANMDLPEETFEVESIRFKIGCAEDSVLLQSQA